MPKPYSYDLRQKVIQAIELDGMKKGEAATVFQVSRNTIHLWLERKASSGDYQAKPNQPPGNGHKITDWDKFTAFVRENGDKTQVEMAQRWDESISDRTISRALDKIGFSRKKRMHTPSAGQSPTRCRRRRVARRSPQRALHQAKTYGDQERDEEKRKEFQEQLEKYSKAERVYLDEAGMDNRDNYGYGYNQIGKRFEALKSGKRGVRINMIAADCNGQLLAPFTIEGACNRSVAGHPPSTVFEIWLETCLVPTLKPGQVVIADNATFHKGGRIQAWRVPRPAEIIKAAGCQLLYLSPYSPDLNKIEQCWSWLKSRIRKQIDKFNCLRDAMEDVLHKAS